MAGPLDEGSRAIGDLEASVRGLKESFDRHCDDDDRRHNENVRTLQANTEALTKLGQMLEPVVASVAVMRPIVDGYQATRARLALWASIGLSLVVFVGWIVEAGLKWMVGWLLSSKFGG